MVTLLRIAACLIEDALRWVLLLFRSNKSVQAENLFLRRQLALYIERGVQPRRIDAATRTCGPQKKIFVRLVASAAGWLRVSAVAR